MVNKPILSKITYVFNQDDYIDGAIEDVEELIVEVKGVFDIVKDRSYFVLRTSTGWSIDDPSDLNYIFDTVMKNNKHKF